MRTRRHSKMWCLLCLTLCVAFGSTRAQSRNPSTLPTTPALISLEESDAVSGPLPQLQQKSSYPPPRFPSTSINVHAHSNQSRNSSSSTNIFKSRQSALQDVLTNGEITRFWKFDKDLRLNLSEIGARDTSSGGGVDEMVPSVESQTMLRPQFMRPAYDHSEHLQEEQYQYQHPADDRILMKHSHRSKQILRLPVYTPLYRKQRIITHIPAAMAHYPPPKRMRQHFQKKKRLFKPRRGKPPPKHHRGGHGPPPQHHHPHPQHQAAMHHQAYTPAFVSYGPIMSPGGPGHGYPGHMQMHAHAGPVYQSFGGGYDYHGMHPHSGEYSHSIQSARYIPPATGPPQFVPIPAAPPLPPNVGKVVAGYIPPNLGPGPAPIVSEGAYPPRPSRRRPGPRPGPQRPHPRPQRPGSAPPSRPSRPSRPGAPGGSGLYQTHSKGSGGNEVGPFQDFPEKEFEFKPKYNWKNSGPKAGRRKPPKPVHGPPSEFDDYYDDQEPHGNPQHDDYDEGHDDFNDRYDGFQPQPNANAPKGLYNLPMPMPVPTSPAPSMLYVPSSPTALYGLPAGGSPLPPMSFGHPMRNFGPPMSSWGQPHPIMGEERPDMYAPKDNMYTYGGGGGGPSYQDNVAVSNPPAAAADKSRRRKTTLKSPVDDTIDHKYYEKVEEQLSKKFQPPMRPFRPRRKPLRGGSAGAGGGGPPPNGNYNSPPRQQQQIASSEQERYNNGPSNNQLGNQNQNQRPTQFDKPVPNYNTNYNSPGLYLDPKIVDWGQYNNGGSQEAYDDYDDQSQARYKRNKSKVSRGEPPAASAAKYSTLPDSFKGFTPDPEHGKYPRLTYDASTVSKRVIKRKNGTSPNSAVQTQAPKPFNDPFGGKSTPTTSTPTSKPSGFTFPPFKPQSPSSRSKFSSRSSQPQQPKGLSSVEAQTENEMNELKRFLSEQATQVHFQMRRRR